MTTNYDSPKYSDFSIRIFEGILYFKKKEKKWIIQLKISGGGNAISNVSIYNGGNGNDFLNIRINTNNNARKSLTGDFREKDTDVQGSNDDFNWYKVPYSSLNNITYKQIKINKIVSNSTNAYLTITQY